MKDVSLYIHIPFCKNKCFYCDFPSFSGCDGKMLEYAKALGTEIDKIDKDYIIKTVFIGGGTPTYLSLDGLKYIKKSIEKLNLAPDVEFTVEGNPGTFTKEKLELFKSMGVNRLSIGLQAYQDNLLKSIGRIHSVEDFEKSYKLARECGYKNINIDLIFGLPNQDIDNWKETLKKVVKLNPEHLSCYSLIIEEDTKFYSLFENDKLKLPCEEDEREMYLKTLEILKENGYNHYEISNFCKPNKECRHNLVYWELKPYIGCGSSSHSYVDGRRYYNESDIEEYIKKINENGSAIIESKKNRIEDDIEEYMFLGLRKIAGVNKKQFQLKFSKDIYEIYGEIINRFKGLKMINDDGEKIYLTEKGIEVSNSIMCEFILEK
ncbi:radical SAM family heme chaperone HemW [Clostridium sp. ATCC 25772]|uniref:radical SAM family heme chaperone HemW n=1 Tax=Clostridium sp. ATCC 25772 TaxID=1676991 RepID=UPI0007860F76|nr:radical SAM family heme chaperone HemW [Clostridium sp. ATCC 25772]